MEQSEIMSEEQEEFVQQRTKTQDDRVKFTILSFIDDLKKSDTISFMNFDKWWQRAEGVRLQTEGIAGEWKQRWLKSSELAKREEKSLEKSGVSAKDSPFNEKIVALEDWIDGLLHEREQLLILYEIFYPLSLHFSRSLQEARGMNLTSEVMKESQKFMDKSLNEYWKMFQHMLEQEKHMFQIQQENLLRRIDIKDAVITQLISVLEEKHVKALIKQIETEYNASESRLRKEITDLRQKLEKAEKTEKKEGKSGDSDALAQRIDLLANEHDELAAELENYKSKFGSPTVLEDNEQHEVPFVGEEMIAIMARDDVVHLPKNVVSQLRTQSVDEIAGYLMQNYADKIKNNKIMAAAQYIKYRV